MVSSRNALAVYSNIRTRPTASSFAWNQPTSTTVCLTILFTLVSHALTASPHNSHTIGMFRLVVFVAPQCLHSKIRWPNLVGERWTSRHTLLKCFMRSSPCLASASRLSSILCDEYHTIGAVAAAPRPLVGFFATFCDTLHSLTASVSLCRLCIPALPPHQHRTKRSPS